MVAGGATSALVGVKAEAEALVRSQLSRLLADMDLVPREEFDAIKAVAVKAREEQEKLETRLAELEASFANCSGMKGDSKSKSASEPKSTSKKAARRKIKPKDGA